MGDGPWSENIFDEQNDSFISPNGRGIARNRSTVRVPFIRIHSIELSSGERKVTNKNSLEKSKVEREWGLIDRFAANRTESTMLRLLCSSAIIIERNFSTNAESRRNIYDLFILYTHFLLRWRAICLHFGHGPSSAKNTSGKRLKSELNDWQRLA